MRRQAYKSKAHETFLEKTCICIKGPQPECRNGNQGYKKEKGFNVPHEAKWVSNGLIYR